MKTTNPLISIIISNETNHDENYIYIDVNDHVVSFSVKNKFHEEKFGFGISKEASGQIKDFLSYALEKNK